MGKNGALGPADLAARVLTAALLGGLTACAHLPPLIPFRDALNAEEHSRLGASYEAQGLNKEAAQQYEAAVRRDPAYAEAWVARGNLSFADGDLAAAERCYRKALKARPGHVGAGNNLAMVYLAQNRRLEEAEKLASDALEQGGPLKPYVLDTLAKVYLRQGRYEEARVASELARTAAPKSEESAGKN